MAKFPEAGRFPRRDDVACASTPHVTKYNQNWGLQDGEKGKDDFPGNELNDPVKLRKGDEPANGWLTVASDTNSEGEDFGKGDGGEER